MKKLLMITFVFLLSASCFAKPYHYYGTQNGKKVCLQGDTDDEDPGFIPANTGPCPPSGISNSGNNGGTRPRAIKAKAVHLKKIKK